VTCNAQDGAGNEAIAETFLIRVVDTTPPVIASHENIGNVEATGADGAAVPYAAPKWTDAVSGTGDATCSPVSGGKFALGLSTVTCDAEDAAGNDALPVTFTVEVIDSTPPVIAAHADIEDVEATGPDGATVTYTAPKWTDLVSGTGDAACTPASGSTFGLGTTTVTCNAEDEAGNNAAPVTFTVEVIDSTPPVIANHSDITGIEATGPTGAQVVYVAPLWTDAVSGSGSATCAPASDTTFALGTTTVTCSAEDAAGNDAVPETFTIDVVDTKPPAIAAVDDILGVEATGPGGAPVSFIAPEWTDIVSGSGTATCAPASGSTFALGNTTVTCSATDGANNTGTGTFKVQVVDTTAPAIDPHADVGPIEATGASGATGTYTRPLARDIVDGNAPAACTPVSGSTFAIGDSTVTCTATDDAGNAATPTTFKVKVRDTIAPVIAAHADVSAEAMGPNGAIVAYASPATSDAVDGNGVAACTQAPGTVFPLGTTMVTCSASDHAGNAAAPTTFKVRVMDTTAPTIAPHADVTATATGNSSAVVTYTNPTASDIVDGTVGVTCAPASGSTFGIGPTTVTCTAQDAAGNTATSTFRAIVSYAFNGFYSPIDNLPMVNTVVAGQAIPVKFSLGGYQGMAIFAAGYPKSIVMSCGGAAQDAVEETLTAGSSTLQYDAGTGRYHYVWKTEKAWSGTCRQLQIRFADGTTQVANFYLRK
jgi:large repetitive protein